MILISFGKILKIVHLSCSKHPQQKNNLNIYYEITSESGQILGETKLKVLQNI